MEPVFGVMGMYEVVLNDQGKVDPGLYMERVAHWGQQYGFVPTAITLGAEYFGDQAQDRGFVRDLKSRLQEMHLRPFSFISDLYLSPKSWEQEASLKRAVADLEFCAGIGAGVVMSGPAFHGRVAREGRMRIAIDLCRRVADAAKDMGLYVGMEDYEYFTGDDFELIFHYADRDNLGLINDTGNWLIGGDDPLTQTIRFRDRIVGCHLRTYRLEMGYWRSVPLGQGLTDDERIIEELWDLPKPYRVPMPIENDLDYGSEIEAQEQALAWLRGAVDRIKAKKAYC